MSSNGGEKVLWLLAGLGIGIYDSLDEISHLWKSERRFMPQMNSSERERYYQGWQKAVASVLFQNR